MFDQKEKCAVVTGAGRGIGRSIALRLAQEGFYIYLIARNESELNNVLEEIKQNNGKGTTIQCDVTNQTNVYQTIESLSSFDLLVNNAGRGGGGKTTELNDEIWHSVINTNLNSVYYLTKAALSLNKLRKPGSIINIASTGGKQGVMYAAAYSASKHGVVGFSKALGLELARSQITVNAVCPGFVNTTMSEKVREAYGKLWGVTVFEAKKRIEERVPIGRYIEPDEVANMVAYLASPAARGITAQAINICGGLGNY